MNILRMKLKSRYISLNCEYTKVYMIILVKRGYIMKVIDVLRMAHTMEVQGMKFYSEQMSNVKNKNLKEIFEHLSKMEEEHANYLKKQIDNIEKGNGLDSLPDSKDDDIFIKRMEQQKIETSSLDSDLGDFSIIRMAYLIERDFEKFYQSSAENADDKNIEDIFQRLSRWENGHAEMLKKQLEDIISRNSLELGFYPL